MQVRRTGVLLVLLTVALAGCNRRALLNCPASPSPALNVTVVEAGTGRHLAAGARVVATDGSFTETLGPGDYAPDGELASRSGVVGRAGRYEVVVTQEGYAEFGTTAQARSGRCGVETVPITAVLERR